MPIAFLCYVFIIQLYCIVAKDEYIWRQREISQNVLRNARFWLLLAFRAEASLMLLLLLLLRVCHHPIIGVVHRVVDPHWILPPCVVRRRRFPAITITTRKPEQSCRHAHARRICTFWPQRQFMPSHCLALMSIQSFVLIAQVVFRLQRGETDTQRLTGKQIGSHRCRWWPYPRIGYRRRG